MKVCDSDIYISRKSGSFDWFLQLYRLPACHGRKSSGGEGCRHLSYVVIHYKSQNCMKKIDCHFLLLTEPPQHLLDTGLAPLGHLSLGLTC